MRHHDGARRGIRMAIIGREIAAIGQFSRSHSAMPIEPSTSDTATASQPHINRSGSELPRPRRALTGGAIRVTALRMVALASSTAVSVLVARLFGPVGTGQFTVAAATIAMLITASTFGFDVGATWMVSTGRWSGAGALHTSWWAAWVFGLASALLGAGLYAGARSLGVGGPALLSMLPVLAALPFCLIWTFGCAIALAMERYEAATIFPGVQVLAYVAAVGVFGSVFGLRGALVGIFIGHVAAAMATMLWARGSGLLVAGRTGGVDLPRCRAAVAFGSKTYVGTALQQVIYRVDLLLLSAYAPRSQVGLYAIAVAVTTPVWTVPASLSWVLLPRVAALSAGDNVDDAGRVTAETRTLRHATGAGGLVGGVIGALILLALPEIFGAGFAGAKAPALILLLGAGALGLDYVLRAGIVGRGEPRYVLITTLISTPVSLILYFVLIPAYGAVGAATASTLSYLLSAGLSGWFLRSLSTRPTIPRMIPSHRELDDYRRLVTACLRAFRRAPDAEVD